MKSAETHPTPQRVVDAIQTVAAWLREIEAAEAVIAPTGSAAFHPTRKADELLAGWQAAEQRIERVKQIANDACQSAYLEWRAGAEFVNMPLSIAARMALGWNNLEKEDV